MKSARRQFDPHAFLAKVGTGKTILKYRKGRTIYAQGEEADRIFYIQSGKVRVTVVSDKLLPKQISQAGIDQLQRKDRGASFFVERGLI